MSEFGWVHLTRVGVPGNVLAKRIRRVIGVSGLEELGMTEASWNLGPQGLGPFIVDRFAGPGSFQLPQARSCILPTIRHTREFHIQLGRLGYVEDGSCHEA